MSADPEDDVDALFLCLHTCKPTDVARMAAVVETLNVLCPSPPVPTISTRPPRYRHSWNGNGETTNLHSKQLEISKIDVNAKHSDWSTNKSI